MEITGDCFICEKTLEGSETVCVQKGVANLIAVSKARKDDKHKQLNNVTSITVHKICRREYIKERNIRSFLDKGAGSSTADEKVLRSIEQFDFKNNCLFCGEKCDVRAEKKKRANLRESMYEIRSLTVRDRILQRCTNRTDEWAENVSRRVNSVICLVAAEARYHNACYSKFLANEPSTRKRGRPQDDEIDSAYKSVCEYIENSDECQFTLPELMRKIEENMTESSSMTMKTLKNKLIEEYGDGVVFVSMRKRPTVVCFRGSGFKVINSWYTERANTEKEERMRIVEAAANIIREDIRTTVYNTTEYPDLSNFTGETKNLVPETLGALLNTIVIKSKKGQTEGIEKKCTAIAHSIISATRPRSFTSPILLGLAVYLFRKVASRNIVQAVSHLGFCSSHNEVSQFENSAVKSWDPDINRNSFSQFVFDNADFNINTMTGKDTFHAMGGIQCVTPYDAVRNKRIIKLAYVPSSEEIASSSKISMQTFHKSKNGIEQILLKNMYTEDAFKRAGIPSAQDFVWMYGKFLQLPTFPAWQGFMDAVTCTLPYTKSQIIALPFLNHAPTDLSTIYSVLNHAAEMTSKLGQTTCMVTFDQPLYLKARDIIAAEIGNEKLSNVVVRLGGFHLLMSYLGSVGYIMGSSGLSELWTTVYASASVTHMLSGHAYARAIRAHILTFSALSTIIIEEMSIDETDKKHLQEILATFNDFSITFGSINDDTVVEKVNNELIEQIRKMRERGKTAQLWLHYYELITIAIHFIQAERTGNWRLHLDCVRAMLPIFHATGHFPYAKSCQIYLQDMESLEQKMTNQEFQKFTKEGLFTIRRSDKHWCGVWSDMTIEQTLMKNMKSVGGITHGRGFTESVLNKWICGLPVAYHVCEALEKFCQIDTKSSHQHVELRDARIEKDEEDCKKFILWLKQHSPFIVAENLISLSSGLVAADNVDCYKAKEIGKKSMEGLIKEGTKFGDLKPKRSNMTKSISSTTNSVTIKDDVIQIDTTQLLQRIICTVRSPQELKTCFSFELATVPVSLFDEKGVMRKTKKSSLYDIFNKVLERPFHCSDDCQFVIDGGNLIHRVVWPKQGTFCDIYSAYVNFIRKNYGQNVTVVFDGYAENADSTKSLERQQRLLKRITATIAFNENTPIHDQQKALLSNLANKDRFISQLAERFKAANIKTLTAPDDADLLIVTSAIDLSHQHDTVVIVGQDIDLLTLIIALAPADKDIRFLKPAQGNIKKRLYSSLDLQSSNVLKNFKETVLFAHAFSGCDTTSAFFGKGKALIISIIDKRTDLEDVVPIFNNPQSSKDDIASAGERFTLGLYKAERTETCLNSYRFTSFNKLVGQSNHAVILARLPPTSAALKQHSYRVFHQIQSWRGEKMEPTQWGWKKMGNMLSPVYNTEAPAPISILEVISCSCKKGCGKRCGCRQVGLRCSTMCSNCHGQGCLNAPSEEILNDGPTDE